MQIYLFVVRNFLLALISL